MRIGSPATSVGIGVQFLLGGLGAATALFRFGIPLLGAVTIAAGLAEGLTQAQGPAISGVAFAVAAGSTFLGGVVALVLAPFWLTEVLVQLGEWLHARRARASAD